MKCAPVTILIGHVTWKRSFLAGHCVECPFGKNVMLVLRRAGAGRSASVAGARELDPRHVVGRVCPRRNRHLGARSTTSKTASSTTSGFTGWRVSGTRPSPCHFPLSFQREFRSTRRERPHARRSTDLDACSDVLHLFTSYPRPQIVASGVKVARSHVSTPPITREMVHP